MLRGSMMEAEARDNYNFLTDENVSEVGFVVCERLLIGCSPDGIGEGGLEIKCPSAGVHAQYLHEKKLPADYKGQVYSSLLICEKMKYWDFFSFHPKMKPFLIRITRDNEDYQAYVEAIEKHIPEFNKLVQEIIKEAS